jgi:beta-lactamase regulating signal transducer with metallopeptidase domain
VTNNLLAALIEANLAAGVAILAVLAIRRRARALVGVGTAYALWLIVPAAMLATLAPPRVVTLAAPAPAASATVSAVPDIPVANGPPTAKAPLSATRTLDVSQVLLGVWPAGVAVSLAMLVVGQRRALMQFGSITADAGDPRLARASKTGVGPAIVGVIRPRLIVPADFETRFDAGERALILAHERTHLVSGHAPINAVIALVQVVNWFNPLIHLAARCARTDQELACDATVISRFPGERRAYARALLKTQLAATSLPLGSAWPARSATLLTQRIEMLARQAPGRARLPAGAAVVATLTVGAGVVAWAAEPPVTEFATPARTALARTILFPSRPTSPRLAEAAPAPSLIRAPAGAVDAAATQPSRDALQPAQTTPEAASPTQPSAATSPDEVAQLAEPQAPRQVVAPVVQSQLAATSEPVVIGPKEAQEPAVPPLSKCQGLAGEWRGSADGPDYDRPLTLHVADVNGALAATLDAPSLSAFHLALEGVRRDGQQIEFAVRSLQDDFTPKPNQIGPPVPRRTLQWDNGKHRWGLSPNLENDWRYVGTLSADGSTIRGSWTWVEPGVFRGGQWPLDDLHVATEFRCMAAAPYPRVRLVTNLKF